MTIRQHLFIGKGIKEIMQILPKARTENIIEQDLGKEILLYDLTVNKAFNLNETSSVIYKACNGTMTFEELKKKHQFTDDFIYLALDELKTNNLLIDESYISPLAGLSRREAIRRVGLASMMTLPAIAFLIAPTAAHAQSQQGCAASGQACTPASNRQSNCCDSTLRCNGGTCQDCLPFLSFFGTCESPGSCQSDCDSLSRKNLCCNGSPAIADTFSLVCLCP